MRRQPQLSQGTEHTIAFHTAKLALLDFFAAGQKGVVQSGRHHVSGFQVLCAGDNLDRLSVSCVDLADPEVIGVGMTFHGNDFRHHHVFDLRAFRFPALHL